MITAEKLIVVLTLKNVKSCCFEDFRVALEKVFDGFMKDGSHDVVHIEALTGCEALAHPDMPIDRFMEAFISQAGELVKAWDEKMAGSKLLTKLGQPFATIRAGLGWIAGFMEGRLDSINDLAQRSVPLNIDDLMTAMPVDVMRKVAEKFGVDSERMSKEEILEAIKKIAGPPEASA